MPLKRNSPTLARLVEGTIGVSNYFRCKYTINFLNPQEYEQKNQNYNEFIEKFNPKKTKDRNKKRVNFKEVIRSYNPEPP